jgi:predicted DNA-binding transcriptional regulator YafY
MNVFHENSPRNRLLSVLRNLLEQPYYYKIKTLAAKYGVSTDSIKNDFEELKNAYFLVEHDKQNRYAIAPGQSAEYLEDVLFFTESEKDFLLTALIQANATDKSLEKIRAKLATIYDVSKLGSSLFSKTFLTKANLLEQAKKQKRVVQLVNYRSTMSSKVSDRLVEPFNISIKEDILHAFDLDKQEIRHFRISRIEKVKVLDSSWRHQGKHYVAATDPFRIVSDQQVFVHLKLRTGALNELIERFPLVQAYIQPCAEQDDLYDFACKVNDEFLGLTNFIMGYFEHIAAIIEPESLIEHVRKKRGEIRF